jgi:protein-S-isoprenylcysteine O-methyltransferase Ste14
VVEGIHAIFNNATLRTALVRLRVPLFALAAVALIPLIDRAWFWPGLGVSFFGQFIQLWCFASLDKNKALAASGPYALVRNPMYLGRYFIVLGAVMLLGEIWLLPVVTVIYYFYMVNRVKREEKLLQKVLGAPYADYCAEVRRFLPSLRPYRGNPVAYFSWDLLRQNNGLRNFAFLAAFYAVAWVFTMMRA